MVACNYGFQLPGCMPFRLHHLSLLQSNLLGKLLILIKCKLKRILGGFLLLIHHFLSLESWNYVRFLFFSLLLSHHAGFGQTLHFESLLFDWVWSFLFWLVKIGFEFASLFESQLVKFLSSQVF